MKILLVEDEAKIASFVRNGLTEHGWSVELSANGDEALDMASHQPYDAIVLDIMLPGRDGLSILKLLRERRNQVPILLLTARGEVSERIEGLQAGADDYLPKPFYLTELIARLESILRRSSGDGSNLLGGHGIELDLVSRKVWITRECGNGPPRREVELSRREFNLLAYLMRSPGRVLSRTQILEQVWDYHFDPGSNLITACVKRIRRKLGDSKTSPIEAVRGVGYRFRSTESETS